MEEDSLEQDPVSGAQLWYLETRSLVNGDDCTRVGVATLLQRWSLGSACYPWSQLLGSICALLMVYMSATGTHTKL